MGNKTVPRGLGGPAVQAGAGRNHSQTLVVAPEPKRLAGPAVQAGVGRNHSQTLVRG